MYADNGVHCSGKGEIMKCVECRYWSRVSEDAGKCKRNAPSTEQTSGFATWPFTTEAEWCGEFEKDAFEKWTEGLCSSGVERSDTVEPFQEVQECTLPNGKVGFTGKNGKCYARKANALKTYG